MGNVILFIIEYVMQVISRLSSYILKPLFDFFASYGLISTNYLEVAQNFLNNYFYKYIRFAKEVIVNVTGLPLNLFIILSTLLTACLLLFFASIGFRFILNVYRLYRIGDTMKGQIK